jgi:hypothetical protein
MLFNVLLDNDTFFKCVNCKNTDFINLKIFTFTPPMMKNNQILKAQFECVFCEKINYIKHTKIKEYKLLWNT